MFIVSVFNTLISATLNIHTSKQKLSINSEYRTRGNTCSPLSAVEVVHFCCKKFVYFNLTCDIAVHPCIIQIKVDRGGTPQFPITHALCCTCIIGDAFVDEWEYTKWIHYY